jgi:hypothetical protein
VLEVIGLSIHWTPFSAKGAASQNWDLSHSCFRSVYNSSTSPQHQKDKYVHKNMTRLCDARLDLLSAEIVVIEVFLGITPCWLVNIDILEEFAFIFRVVVVTGLSIEATDFFETPVRLPLYTASHQKTHPQGSGSGCWMVFASTKSELVWRVFAGDLVSFHSCCCWGLMPFGILRRVGWYTRLFGRTVVP